MPKRYKISSEQIVELETARKTNTNKKVDRRLRAILLHAKGMKRSEIAKATEYDPSYVSGLVSKYCSKGLSTIVDNHYAGNRRNMSFDEEAALLESFKEAADAGQVVDVKEIKLAYETALGRSMERDKGQIYRVLARHGWRKVMPRSKHPKKASDEAIEASKKLKKSLSKNDEIWVIPEKFD